MWEGMVRTTLENALNDKQIDMEAYERLTAQIAECPEDERESFMEDVVTALRDHLLSRIVKGAEYIESIGKDHPQYAAAMKKYDSLCEQLLNADRRKYRDNVRTIPNRNRRSQEVG